MLTLALVAALAGSTLVGSAPAARSAPPIATPEATPEPSPPQAPPPAPAGEPPVDPDPSLGATPPVDPAAPSEADPATGLGTEPPVDPPVPADPDPAADPNADPEGVSEAAPDPAAEAEAEADADASAGDPFELQPPPSTEDPAPGRRRYPPSLYGRGWVSAGLGASSRHFAFGVGAVYFVIPWVGVGLDLDDTVVFGETGYNVFELLPKIVVVALPYRRVTPLVQTGFGGAFFNEGIGAYGRWVAGAGLAMAFGRFNMRAGVDVEGLVPDSRFAAQGFRCVLTDTPCSLGVAPWLGFGFGF